jgi:hypothetical protein
MVVYVFRHDHRHPDGTPEELTLYGGYSDGTGTPFVQHFPADQYTVDLLSDTLDRQWNVVWMKTLQVSPTSCNIWETLFFRPTLT